MYSWINQCNVARKETFESSICIYIYTHDYMRIYTYLHTYTYTHIVSSSNFAQHGLQPCSNSRGWTCADERLKHRRSPEVSLRLAILARWLRRLRCRLTVASSWCKSAKTHLLSKLSFDSLCKVFCIVSFWQTWKILEYRPKFLSVQTDCFVASHMGLSMFFLKRQLSQEFQGFWNKLHNCLLHSRRVFYTAIRSATSQCSKLQDLQVAPLLSRPLEKAGRWQVSHWPNDTCWTFKADDFCGMRMMISWFHPYWIFSGNQGSTFDVWTCADERL